MTQPTQPYKGTRDFYPEDQRIQNWLMQKFSKVTESFGYEPYNGPMLEPFDLYAAKSGEEIVKKQLYHFQDQADRHVAIRPEMTPTLARMVAGKLQELPRPIRWYSFPNLWRYEQPQRGRLREHWQLNVDILGGDRDLADAEALAIAVGIFEEFGARDKIQIRLNNRALVNHVFREQMKISDTVSLALSKLLDAKDKMKPEAFDAGLIALGLDADQRRHLAEFLAADFTTVAQRFDCAGAREIARIFELAGSMGYADVLVFDPAIMRGLDYYTGTVFEAYDVSPENRRALFGGGRYDDLIGLFSKKDALSGMGFGLGDVGMRNFLETHGLLNPPPSVPDLVVTCPEAGLLARALDVATKMRALGFCVLAPTGALSFKQALKQGDRSGSRFVLLMGEEELKQDLYILKNMKTGEQTSLRLDQIASVLGV
ncbi:MAG TPA: histidine--tRNA ligase [Bdellovibrionota bacterium]|nr:histidine--tRNA ligase [Bdellovibrionota bacterium]